MKHRFEKFLKHNLIAILFILLAIVFAYGFGFTSGMANSTNEQVRTVFVAQNNSQFNTTQVRFPEPLENVSLALPGIDKQGKGTSALLIVQRRNGTGRVFLNFDENAPVIANETQESLQTAVHVARRFSSNAERNFETSDLLYSFNTLTSEIGGESAGAGFAVATIALLEGKKLNRSIAITGRVNADGEIESVGNVLEKARALKASGIKLFLVPPGDSIKEMGVSREVENCTEQPIGGGTLNNCTTRTVVETRLVNVANETGLSIIEVRNVAEAYQRMVVK